MKKIYIFTLALFFLCFYGSSQTTETENFDSYGSDTNISTGTATTSGFWNGASDYSNPGEYPWRVESNNGSNSGSTGPNQAYNGTGYLYAETTNDDTADEFVIESDTFSATST